jgi:hypothetical protein
MKEQIVSFTILSHLAPATLLYVLQLYRERAMEYSTYILWRATGRERYRGKTVLYYSTSKTTNDVRRKNIVARTGFI